MLTAEAADGLRSEGGVRILLSWLAPEGVFRVVRPSGAHMYTRRRGLLAVTAVLLVAAVGEVAALRSGTLGDVIVAGVAALALVLVLVRANVAALGLWAAYLCAFTLTWNGWFVGPLRPGDVLILVTLVLLVIANPNRAFLTPPWWVKQLAVAIILVALLTILRPPDPLYLAQRVVLDATGQPTVDTKSSLPAANIGVAFKYIVAVVATPTAFAGATLVDRRAARRLGIAFAAGAAASGWAATLDHVGANIGHLITRLPNSGSRQFGFANHPNFLAAGTVLAIPFAFWLLASRNRREQVLGLVCMIGLLGGVYASGSRGGAVCAVAVLALCVALHRRTRPYAPMAFVGGGLLAVAVAVVIPSVGREILKVTRLSGGVTTEGSDTVRALVGAQGIRDFQHSPIHGIGLQASFDASQVYLQELASGGIILFIGMNLYMAGGIFTAWRRLKRDDIAMACLGSMLAILALNIFEADLTDRFYYVPAAILIAMVRNQDRGSDVALEKDFAPPAEPIPALPSGRASP